MLHGKFELGLGLGLGIGLPHQKPRRPSLPSVRLVVRSAFVLPVNPDHLWPQSSNPTFEGSQSSSRSNEWRVYANRNVDEDDNNSSKKKKRTNRWFKDNESSLNRHEPLPLPMSYPGSTPNHQDVEKMMNCDTEKEDCKDVLYQWTGKCTRCHGTGEVSYYPKKGREVICKCIPCMGLGTHVMGSTFIDMACHYFSPPANPLGTMH